MSAGKRIRNLRTGLHLSHEYVANQLEINRKDYAQIESGRRELKPEELMALSQLFGVSEKMIADGTPQVPVKIRDFEKLNEHDQMEIMNLLMFREQMKARA